MSLKFDILEEIRDSPLIVLWGCELAGNQLNFDIGYLASGYGSTRANLKPYNANSPVIVISLPRQTLNLPGAIIMTTGSSFNIEQIDYSPISVTS